MPISYWPPLTFSLIPQNSCPPVTEYRHKLLVEHLRVSYRLQSDQAAVFYYSGITDFRKITSSFFLVAPQPKSSFFVYSTLMEWKVLLKSLEDKIMTSSLSFWTSSWLPQPYRVYAENKFFLMYNSVVLCLLCSSNLFAFEEILFTDLSLMSDFQSQNLSVHLPPLRSASTNQPGLSFKRQGTFLSKKEESIPM